MRRERNRSAGIRRLETGQDQRILLSKVVLYLAHASRNETQVLLCRVRILSRWQEEMADRTRAQIGIELSNPRQLTKQVGENGWNADSFHVKVSSATPLVGGR